jgi:NAD(P)-dependent dehydrogenase (short-subunit alcohol dehydrogenase family)
MGIELDGKAGIVTGAARGIGKGMATALLKAGMAVTITDVRADTLAETSAAFDQIPGARHLSVVADGTVDDDVTNAVQAHVDAFGRIDMVINAAQVAVSGPLVHEQTVDDLMVAVDSGLFGSFRYMKAAHPYLRESQGTVLNFASQSGLIGIKGSAGYNIAKEGIRGLTRTAAQEWAADNITVNCIIPGMLTEGMAEFFATRPEHQAHSLASIPLGRLGDPEKDAGAFAVFLASEGAHYFTGETFDLDGGRCMRP